MILLLSIAVFGCWACQDASLILFDEDADGVVYEFDCDDKNPELAETSTLFVDCDRDGWGDWTNSVTICDVSDTNEFPNDGHCGDQGSEYVLIVEGGGDCDDLDPERSPDSLWYRDEDGDGFGNPQVWTQRCIQPEGFVPNDSDCDDNRPGDTILADGDIICLPEVGDSVSNECGEDGPLLGDSDGDGFDACVDCHDEDPSIFPGAPERCDGDTVDNDCDGKFDEDPIEGFEQYEDLDGDGYGSRLVITCESGLKPPYVVEGGDCDDGDWDIHPGAVEACDGVDNDCDGVVDSGFGVDVDGDGELDCDTLSISLSSVWGSEGGCDWGGWNVADLGGITVPYWSLTESCHLQERSLGGRSLAYAPDLGSMLSFRLTARLDLAPWPNENVGLVFGFTPPQNFLLVQLGQTADSSFNSLSLERCSGGVCRLLASIELEGLLLSEEEAAGIAQFPHELWLEAHPLMLLEEETADATVSTRMVWIGIGSTTYLSAVPLLEDGPLLPGQVGIYSEENDLGVVCEEVTLSTPIINPQTSMALQ